MVLNDAPLIRGQGVAQVVFCVPGDLSLRCVLVEGLDELGVLLLDLLGGLVRRSEQQVLEVVVQVLAGRRSDLPISNPRLQVAHKRCSRRSDRRLRKLQRHGRRLRGHTGIPPGPPAKHVGKRDGLQPAAPHFRAAEITD